MNESYHSHTSSSLIELRERLRNEVHADEEVCVAELLKASSSPNDLRQRAQQRATEFVDSCRAQSNKHNLLDAFLQEFSLSNQEGIALMCLAEALLRIPDKDTADTLINEKISAGDWGRHFRQSDSSLVNMATVGLMLTGSFVSLNDKFTGNPSSWLPALGKKVGEPVVRQAIRQAMSIMGGQYVLGRNIEEAAKLGREDNREETRFSFDMLGEGARTMRDAQKYFDAYLTAINAIGNMIEGGVGKNVIEADGISVKLSALHPRYHFSHRHTVMSELLPQLVKLAKSARQYNIGFTIDAEESERLDISLDLFESLVRDEALADWDGLGLVVQAYQKRAPLVINWLATLARESDRQLMVRLVKGAYWDREIKFAQEQGYADYPVFTRKQNTDLCYQVCVEMLLAANDVLFPQFATHNAHTAAVVWELVEAHSTPNRPRFEFQRLHGMGDLLYGEVYAKAIANSVSRELPLRVYAPVGAHKDLLPYLVRRLLENGANSSFVNQFLDKDTPVADIVTDPVEEVRRAESYRHPKIPLPIDIYRASGRDGGNRDNSSGLDLDNPATVADLYRQFNQHSAEITAAPIVNGQLISNGQAHDITSPANHASVAGRCINSSEQDVENALAGAADAQSAWNKLGGKSRSEILARTADLLEQHMVRLMQLVSAEAGRILPDTVTEVREAVDFCRYYGLKAEQHFSEPLVLPGPTGEQNLISLHGRGTFVCISPWNFPLAIFVGQIAAALAAGNSVIAKPAEQTPIVAFEAVKLFHQAGVPGEALQLLTGKGSELGPRLVNDPRVSGVCFTGSNSVAKFINRQLAERPGAIVPLIAETGGQNAIIVDSSALHEQVVDDVINSAFNSAGQRCSALRVLFLQEQIADKVIEMLVGAMDALELGDPLQLSTDIGPVIDDRARAGLEQHIAAMQASERATIIARFDRARVPDTGSFFAPAIIEIDSINLLQEEVFGPVLHIVRYHPRKLEAVLEDINNAGFGLTLGVHSRRAECADTVYNKTNIGNTYINRNIVGAVVGVQPFGGQGLSGTGPKA
ncbi:MAG: bifunctional proline dehydrogenase/L-glutamate gamma-semialdehyde dehydrogenase PutA, partial [Gammaproteobacteria bacterium]|nr:bifunctional proline dehydrogenase/L-glutamate gamma-semialdehyde dehydrogenase PutA [Gammaproteobacteria bacterium]